VPHRYIHSRGECVNTAIYLLSLAIRFHKFNLVIYGTARGRKKLDSSHTHLISTPMITKTINPILSGTKVAGTVVEYRLFGILICRKTLYLPTYFGAEEYDLIYRI